MTRSSYTISNDERVAFTKALRALAEINKILEGIEARRKLSDQVSTTKTLVGEGRKDGCEHRMIYVGHGHNYSVYTCTKCGYSEEQ